MVPVIHNDLRVVLRRLLVLVALWPQQLAGILSMSRNDR